MDFPKMSLSESFDSNTKYFSSRSKCRTCGDYRRWWPHRMRTVGPSCYSCEPDVQGSTVSQINSDLRKKEKRVKAAMRENWVVPIVYRSNFK